MRSLRATSEGWPSGPRGQVKCGNVENPFTIWGTVPALGGFWVVRPVKIGLQPGVLLPAQRQRNH